MDEGLNQLAGFVQQKYGLNFTKKLLSLELKTKTRLSELNCTYEQYCLRLLADSKEREKLVELLTVHETYFFREDNHLRELCEVVIPSIQETARAAPIRIWSAACSTGEEPYSIAMMIRETLGQAVHNVRIVATDIDAKTLDIAREGLYSSKSFTFRRTPERYLKQYFEQEGSGFRVKREIRRMVEFRQLNLVDTKSMEPLGLIDVIFCRNVLIYFDDVGKDHVVRSLRDRLKPNGYLFMGHAESIQKTAGLRTIRAPGTFYYQKEADKSCVTEY